MAEKTKEKKISSAGIWGEYNYNQIKKEAVRRGMPFTDVILGDYYKMISFLESDRAYKIPNDSKIREFDDWMDAQLSQVGADYLRKPSLRLGYISEEKGELVVKTKSKKKTPKEPKKKRELTENGLVKGTKKEYTCQLAQKGYPVEKVIKRVLRKFPDASEKSIIIWFRKFSNQTKPRVKLDKDIKKKPKRVAKTEEQLQAARERAKERRNKRKEAREKANSNRVDKIKENKNTKSYRNYLKREKRRLEKEKVEKRRIRREKRKERKKEK